ncbi:hypothetical protein PCH_Pc22g21050 [Penicillium rubens Wisconsin 54-1255]|uniref:Uncharacterized protein n=1 Tax=Penicillium rubens (strain ATCC 28089 / DSM 1075 / NRRL 1951 / Wisconsin 54-1255) TaxID=500485 RepID=B6HS21_PENRW|nr:hypothetical protein PCH_Pc22g21050 [Penicillium rubens Wisconsin 54-1255]
MSYEAPFAAVADCFNLDEKTENVPTCGPAEPRFNIRLFSGLFPSSYCSRSGAIIREKAWLYSSPERWLPKELLFNLDTSQGEKTSTLCLRVKEQDAHTVLLPTPYSVNQRSSYQENVCALGRNRNFPKTPHLASAVDMLVDYAGHRVETEMY